MTELKHFLDLDLIDAVDLRQMIQLGVNFKNGSGENEPLAGKSLAMIFEKPSTRTRVSFEVGMKQLGGKTIVLNHDDMQIGRGETIADTARVLSRYVDAIMLRTNHPDKLEELAHHATVPVINALTDRSHPCQLMADVMTFEEHRGSIAGRKIAWVGDGNNMAVTWLHAATKFNFELILACPEELSIPRSEIDRALASGTQVTETTDPAEAVSGADCVVTDTWVSMGDQPGERRHRLLEPYRVDQGIMEKASADAIFMHCLPAHRGEEVTSAVLEGKQSVVWDEAENRLHAQKGILVWCLG
ncbi:MAG: ornithine carbamoyltransferase [Rhodospirillaceae bacterium]|nr:ornithine carbamoyltransferase [Rhodospirillaceae bacterium]|tara:strand:- start:6103 stop:7005 length:903 start_codon:yes stop_codon:yes gene_type:complete